jgi:hypothetical protein
VRMKVDGISLMAGSATSHVEPLGSVMTLM